MPPYVSASDFVLTLPAMVPTITGSSIPLSIDEVATICARVGVELDSAAAGAGYAVPVSTTATQAYAQMALWQGYGAGWLVLRDIFPNMGGPGDNTSLAGEYRAQYVAALKNLRTGAEPLVGAALAGDGAGRELPRSYSVSNPGATSGVVPRFTVGDQFQMPNRIFGGTRSGAGGVSVSMHPPLEFILRQTGAFKASLLDLHPLWELFEPITAQMEEEQFDTEGHGDWPPLADSTLNQKLAHGWPMAMLDRTGDLRTSLTDPGSAADKGAMQMTWSTDIEYAHFHQTGGYVVGRPPQRQVIPDPVPVKQRRKFEKAMVGWINLTARETFGRIAA